MVTVSVATVSVRSSTRRIVAPASTLRAESCAQETVLQQSSRSSCAFFSVKLPEPSETVEVREAPSPCSSTWSMSASRLSRLERVVAYCAHASLFWICGIPHASMVPTMVTIITIIRMVPIIWLTPSSSRGRSWRFTPSPRGGGLKSVRAEQRYKSHYCASSQRSASIAAMQPIPAAVTACR